MFQCGTDSVFVLRDEFAARYTTLNPVAAVTQELESGVRFLLAISEGKACFHSFIHEHLCVSNVRM